MPRRLALGLVLLATACSSSGQAEDTQPVPPTSSPSVETTTTVAATRTFVGIDGVESTITDTSRIVTLSGDLTEVVFALGFGSSVVATDVTTVHPAEAVGLPIVGVGRFLTAEGVLGEAPTLVLGDTQTSPLETIEQIRSAGVPVVILDVPTTFEGLYQKLEQIGVVLGVAEEARSLAADVRSSIEATLAEAPRYDPQPRIAFVYSRGPDVMLLFGSEMTTQPLIEAVGGVDVGAGAGVVGTVSVTPEAMVAASPDVIIITSEGLEALGGIDGLLTLPGFAETPAGRDRRILDYPEGDILTFGPRIADTLRELVIDLQLQLDDS
ncbi:MAG TPA: ABC transporter substrate-binding protein [Acidimicrobiia bacterium]|nr:ABC transporter substrate-binding protein [Acidimicrobiia bacterium]